MSALSDAQSTFYSSLSQDSMIYLYSRYSLLTLIELNFMAQDAQASGLTNRALYIKQLRTWLMSVLSYYNSVNNSISGAADISTLSPIAWNFSSFNSSDPLITISGALAITN